MAKINSRSLPLCTPIFPHEPYPAALRTVSDGLQTVTFSRLVSSQSPKWKGKKLKKTNAKGQFHFRIIIEKPRGAFVCDCSWAVTQHILCHIINGMFSDSVLTNLNNKVP